MTRFLSSRVISAVWQANATNIGLLYRIDDYVAGTILQKNGTEEPLAPSPVILDALLPVGDNLLEVTRCGLSHTLTLRSRSYQVIASRPWHSQMKHLLSASLDPRGRNILLCTRTVFTDSTEYELESVNAFTLETVPTTFTSIPASQSSATVLGCVLRDHRIWQVTNSAIETIDGRQGDQPATRILLKSQQHLILRNTKNLCFIAGLDPWLEIVSLTTGTTTIIPLPPGESFKEPVGMDVFAVGSDILVLVAFRRLNSSECVAHQWAVSRNGPEAVMRF